MSTNSNNNPSTSNNATSDTAVSSTNTNTTTTTTNVSPTNKPFRPSPTKTKLLVGTPTHVSEPALEFLISGILAWVEYECLREQYEPQTKLNKPGQSGSGTNTSEGHHPNAVTEDEEDDDEDTDEEEEKEHTSNNNTDTQDDSKTQQTPKKSNHSNNNNNNNNDSSSINDYQTMQEKAMFAAEHTAVKMEQIGYDVGYRLVERLAQSKFMSIPNVIPKQPPQPPSSTTNIKSDISTSSTIASTTPTTTTTTQQQQQTNAISSAVQLEAVKFLCKEVWTTVYSKQIDKLQTNHRGVFVLRDFSFKWLTRLPAAKKQSQSQQQSQSQYHYDDEQSRIMAIKLLAFPCGLIRGALANLGIGSVVSCDFLADGVNMESCSFNIKVKN